MLAKVPVAEPRFSISTLEVEDENVWLTLMDGMECVGRMWLTDTGKQRFERWEGGKRYTKLPYQFVALWRPVDARAWRFQLPLDSATLTKEIPKPKLATSEPEEFIAESQYWPLDHYVHLGRPGEAPDCIEEVESRFLRALRTSFILERELRQVETLWPRPFLDAIKAIQEQYRSIKDTLKKRGIEADPEMFGWRLTDHDDYYADGSLDARPMRFSPTPRDVSDYEAGSHKAWLALMWKRDRHLFYGRADLPPLQWWMLADEQRVDESKIKERYRDALEMVFEKVRGR
jgi:hypothetical protein